MTVYLVTGTATYRGHEPGTRFEAHLDENAERRAIARGRIMIVEPGRPRLRPGSYTLPVRRG